jgi:hypothetical protein
MQIKNKLLAMQLELPKTCLLVMVLQLARDLVTYPYRPNTGITPPHRR